MAKNDDFAYEIVEHVAVLKTFGSGWTRELNVISWNGGKPKYDVRDWPPTHELKCKGVTFSEEEAILLVNALGGRLSGTEVA